MLDRLDGDEHAFAVLLGRVLRLGVTTAAVVVVAANVGLSVFEYLKSWIATD